MKRVRPADEWYWDTYRTAPKAFIPLAAGQALWHTRYGQLTSVRLHPAAPPVAAADAAATAAAVRSALPSAIDPLRAGFAVVDVRRQNLAASAGATDFGAYFSYFSAFLMVSALLLSALFFRLSVEQRLAQIGTLRAGGFSLRDVRRLLLIEGFLVAGAGGVLGVLQLSSNIAHGTRARLDPGSRPRRETRARQRFKEPAGYSRPGGIHLADGQVTHHGNPPTR